MNGDYRTEKMQEVEVCGIRCEFSDMRITSETIPEGKFQYEVAHDDEGLGDPARVKKSLWVNFFGTIISDTELPLDED